MQPAYAPALHLAISFALALAAGSLAARFRPGHGTLRAGAIGFVASLLVGLAKEVHDLLENPWSMPLADLRADSAMDMAWNIAGATAGALAFLAIAVLAAGRASPRSS